MAALALAVPSLFRALTRVASLPSCALTKQWEAICYDFQTSPVQPNQCRGRTCWVILWHLLHSVRGVGSATLLNGQLRGEVAHWVGLIPVGVAGERVQVGGGVEQKEESIGIFRSDMVCG